MAGKLCGLLQKGQMFHLSTKYLGVSHFKSHCFAVNFTNPHQHVKVTTMIQTRNFVARREVNPRVEENLKKMDSIPKEYNLIYRAPLLLYMRSTYALTFVSITGLPLLFLYSYIGNSDMIFPSMINDKIIVNNFLEFTGFVLGLALIATQVSLVVFKYPMRIYNNPETGHYKIIFQSLLPWQTKQEEFVAGEMAKYDSILPWGDSMYKFNDKKVLLLEEHFKRPYDFLAMFKPQRQQNED